MAKARALHTATLLGHGRVLVTGGQSGFERVASAEVYDPDGDSWSSIGSMTRARSAHSATRLSDGTVLVAGGTRDFGQADDSAETYDRANNTWSDAGRMAVPRALHTATRLPDGRLLVAGGVGASQRISASAEVFDPSNGTWQSTGSMAEPRAAHTATLLLDGKVLVAGGFGSGVDALGRAELYDPASGEWSPAGSMVVQRVFHAATLLPDGRVLVAGGQAASGQAAKATAEKSLIQRTMDSMMAHRGISSVTASAISTNDFAVNPTGTGAIALGAGPNRYIRRATTEFFYCWDSNGKITHQVESSVECTDAVADREVPGSVEIYDPTADQWSTVRGLAESRERHTATLLDDGRVIVIGGEGDFGDPLSSSEVYDPKVNAWTFIEGSKPPIGQEEFAAPRTLELELDPAAPARTPAAPAPTDRPRPAPTVPVLQVPVPAPAPAPGPAPAPAPAPAAPAPAPATTSASARDSEETAVSIAIRGSVIAFSNTANQSVERISFQISNATETGQVMSSAAAELTVEYTDSNQFVSLANLSDTTATQGWTATWISGTGPLLDSGERVEMTVGIQSLSYRLGVSQEFSIRVTPSLSASLVVTRTTPAELTRVSDLN